MRVWLSVLDAVVEPAAFADTLDHLLLFAFAVAAPMSEHRSLDGLSAPSSNVRLHLLVRVFAWLAWHHFLAQRAHRDGAVLLVLPGAVMCVVAGACSAERGEAAIAAAWQKVQPPALRAMVP